MIDDLVQLHEGIEIIYVVDGYEARLYTHDGYKLVASANGNSILEALKVLEQFLEGKTLEEIRKL